MAAHDDTIVTTRMSTARTSSPLPPAGDRSPSTVAAVRPPDDCRRILIVGAGGFGREVLQWAHDSWPDHVHRFAGFLSDDIHKLDGHATSVGIVGTAAGYEAAAGDYLLLAIGVPYSRRRVAETLRARGGRFLTLVHPRAVVAASAQIGAGSVICPCAVVSDAATLGSCVLINYHASLGHDASAGDYAVLSPYATLGGGAIVDEECFLGLHASVGPGRRLGARGKVSANSCVLSDAPADALVFGVPGRVTIRVDVSGSFETGSDRHVAEPRS